MSPYTEAMKTMAVAKPVIDPSGSTIAVSTAIPAPMKIHILRPRSADGVFRECGVVPVGAL